MAIPYEMPKMTDTMEEGVLVAWLVDEGTAVLAGDVIAQVETDKATMDLEVYDDGTLLKKVIAEGESVPIGALIAVLGEEGEDISDILASVSAGASPKSSAGSSAEETIAKTDGVSATPENQPPGGDGVPSRPAQAAAGVESDDGRLKSSPLARRLAREHGLSLGGIRGTGPEGRIVKRDIEAVLASGVAAGGMQVAAPTVSPPPPAVPAPTTRPAAAVAPPPPFVAPAVPAAMPDSVPLSQMRKAVARRLSESKYTAPHFYLTVDVDMDRSISARTAVNAIVERHGGQKISYNDFVTKACAVSLMRHPAVNATYAEKEGKIVYHKTADVAVAVAIDEGLITPVIRSAHVKSLPQIGAETKDLAARARSRKLQPNEFEGSTFTTSNLGMFGIEEFTAIINPPNSCILAIGAIRDEPVVKDGAVVAGKRMKLTLSCDHRLVDGATGAAFLVTVKEYLEEPATMLL